MDERLEKQLNFILKLDQEKNVFRRTHITGGIRRENDAEHSWHMAVMAYLLREYSNVSLDIGKVILLCLIHDIVEIEAGDTYAYDAKGLKTQREREKRAMESLFSILPPDQQRELTDLFEEFEAFETPESKFAHAMDNLQPLLLNHSNGGQDWKNHRVRKDQVYARQETTRAGSEVLFAYIDSILRENIKNGNILM